MAATETEQTYTQILIYGVWFAYLGYKCTEMLSHVTISGISIMLGCSGFLYILFVFLICQPVAFGALELSSQSISKLDSNTLYIRKCLSINLIIVGSLGATLALSAGLFAIKCAADFTTAMKSQVEPLRQLNKPLEPPQRQPGRCPRGKVSPSLAAYGIFDGDGNVNNSMIRKPTPPPSYDNLNVHSSVITNSVMYPALSTERTPPPSYSSVIQTGSRNYVPRSFP